MRSAIVSGIVTGDALLSYLLLLANFFPCPKQQSKKSLWKLTRPSFLVSTVASVTPLSFFSDNACKTKSPAWIRFGRRCMGDLVNCVRTARVLVSHMYKKSSLICFHCWISILKRTYYIRHFRNEKELGRVDFCKDFWHRYRGRTGQLILRKRHSKSEFELLQTYRAHSNSLNSSNVSKLFWSWILKDYIKVQEKKKESRLCSRPRQNVKLDTFRS